MFLGCIFVLLNTIRGALGYKIIIEYPLGEIKQFVFKRY